MRWRRSGDGDGGVEDMRGSGGGGLRGPAAIGGGLGGLGLVGVIIAIVVVFLGGGGGGFSPDATLDGLGASPAASGQGIDATGPDADNTKAFVVFVVNDVQKSWKEQFQRAGETYPPTTLRLFSGRIQTGCGAASAASGPFYCPVDRRVYLDMAFFRELSTRFGAPGDFAQAYVIAHEFGHHVQNVLGILPQVQQEMESNPSQANALSVKLELQADCLAGVWAHSAYGRNLLEDGDLEEGLAAATGVGDDTIQRQGGGYVDPDTFTHGTAAQRRSWFLAGFQSGEVAACDTFRAQSL